MRTARLVPALRMWLLRLRAGFLQAQVDDKEELLRDHQARLEACRRELHNVQKRIAVATITGDSQALLNEAMKRKAA